MMSSSRVASEWISSRSSGVMNERSSRATSSRLTSSAARSSPLMVSTSCQRSGSLRVSSSERWRAASTEYSASDVNSSKNRSSLGSSRMAIGTFSVDAAQPVRRLRQPVNLAQEPLAELVHLALGGLVGDNGDHGVVAALGLDRDSHGSRTAAP